MILSHGKNVIVALTLQKFVNACSYMLPISFTLISNVSNIANVALKTNYKSKYKKRFF